MGKKRKPLSGDTYSERLAIRLVSRREELGLSVDEVVQKMAKAGYEVAAMTYRQWESNRRRADTDAIPAICKALRMKPLELLPAK